MGAIQRLLTALRGMLRRLFATGGSGYLCDHCKWDYGDACSRPERPNAVRCPDYQRR